MHNQNKDLLTTEQDCHWRVHRDPERSLIMTGTGIFYLCLILDLFMLQNTVVYPVHEYTDIYVCICAAFPNRAI